MQLEQERYLSASVQFSVVTRTKLARGVDVCKESAGRTVAGNMRMVAPDRGHETDGLRVGQNEDVHGEVNGVHRWRGQRVKWRDAMRAGRVDSKSLECSDCCSNVIDGLPKGRACGVVRRLWVYREVLSAGRQFTQLHHALMWSASCRCVCTLGWRDAV